MKSDTYLPDENPHTIRKDQKDWVARLDADCVLQLAPSSSLGAFLETIISEGITS